MIVAVSTATDPTTAFIIVIILLNYYKIKYFHHFIVNLVLTFKVAHFESI